MKCTIVVLMIGNFGRKGYYHSQEIGLGKMLMSMGHDVTVIKCVSNKNVDSKEISLVEGLKVIYLPVQHLGVQAIFPVNEIDSDSDTVITFSDTQLCVGKIYRYCMLNNINLIPYVGIAHSFQKTTKSKVMDSLFKLTTMKVYKKLPIICKTTTVEEELMQLGARKCYVAPVGIDFEELKNNKDGDELLELREKYGYKQSDVIVSFVGRLQPEKRPIDMLKIFQKMKRINKKLLMVGDGELKKEVIAYIEKNNLKDSVQLFFQVPYEKMWEIHSMADFFVNLRTEEIFGMAVMEAVYYRSCVLARSAPGPDTIVQNMKEHKTFQTDDEILYMLDNYNPNSTQLNIDREFLIKNFTWKKCAKTIENIVASEL